MPENPLLLNHEGRIARHEERLNAHAERLKDLDEKKVDQSDYAWMKRGVMLVGAAVIAGLITAFFKIVLKS